MRQELSNWIKQNLAKPVIEINLHNTPPADPILAIKAAAEGAPEKAVLFVMGLEYWLTELNAERQRETIRALNWRRNELARINRPLVFIVPEFTIPLLAEGAPDFWDWHSGLYEFAIPKQEKFTMMVQDGIQDTSINNLTEEQKRERILLLNQLLDEYAGPTELEKRKSAEIRYQLGQLYSSLGHYDKALKAFQEALKIQEKKNKKGIAACLNEIGEIYLARANYDMALKYLKESLQIRREIGDRAGEDATLNNISQIYRVRGDNDTALRYLEESLAIRRSGIGLA
ncbi:MAG: tetratricopeptide repeat protein [candidate division KSB1 bacterium]|nr:tetratricopeptide repeat protein [candidate division KSB1 bacterium]